MDKNIHGYFFNQLNKFLLRTTRSNKLEISARRVAPLSNL